MPEAQSKPRRMREIVKANEWGLRVAGVSGVEMKTLRKVAGNIELSVEDIRDDAMSVIRNSGLSFDEIEARLGATAKTLKRWDLKEVARPQMGKVRQSLRACGYDLKVVPVGGNDG